MPRGRKCFAQASASGAWRSRGRPLGSLWRSVRVAAQKRQLDLLRIERFSRRFLACSGQKIVLASHVGADHFFVVEGKGQRIEHLGWAELWVPFQNTFDTGPAAVERPKAA